MMSFGEKLSMMRKKENLTQDQLADLLSVSRQSVSKWESDIAYPETEKLIKISEIFKCSLDYLFKDEEVLTNEPINTTKESIFDKLHYEYKSKKMLFGKPLVHVNVGLGLYKANGIISIGVFSKGIISLGIFSMGLLSLGIFSLGLLALGVFSLGLVSIAAIAIGVIAIGAIAIGLLAIGALSIGVFSFGALSIAKYVAVGHTCYGNISIASDEAHGIYEFVGNYNKDTVYSLIDNNVPTYWKAFIEIIKWFL